MDQVAIHIGLSERTAALTYVAQTRVRTLDGVAFLPPFDLPRLQKLGKTVIQRRESLELKMRSMSFFPEC